jgi:hypothetical protein
MYVQKFQKGDYIVKLMKKSVTHSKYVSLYISAKYPEFKGCVDTQRPSCDGNIMFGMLEEAFNQLMAVCTGEGNPGKEVSHYNYDYNLYICDRLKKNLHKNAIDINSCWSTGCTNLHAAHYRGNFFSNDLAQLVFLKVELFLIHLFHFHSSMLGMGGKNCDVRGFEMCLKEAGFQLKNVKGIEYGW